MLSENQISFFKNNGYLVVEPNIIYNDKELYELNEICKKNFLSYEDGSLEKNIQKYNPEDFIIDCKNIKYYQNGTTNNRSDRSFLLIIFWLIFKSCCNMAKK